MINQAIAKINAEMQKNSDDLYTEIVGQYVIDRITDNETAKKILADKKDLKGAMDAVMKKAKLQKRGNVAVLTPAEVFGAVDAYFGLKRDDNAQMKAMLGAGAPATVPAAAPAEKPKSGLRLDLADFL